MGKLDIYNYTRTPQKEALKEFDSGSFQGTDINTMWRIKTLTELYGPCGIGWYYTTDKQWLETAQNGDVMAFVDITLYVKEKNEWSKPIPGTGGNKFTYTTKPKGDKPGYTKVNDECFKMAATDALGNALRNLGFGADVYWAEDHTKYSLMDYETKLEHKVEWETAEKELFEAAKKYKFQPYQIRDALAKSKGVPYYTLTPDDLIQAKDEMVQKHESKA